MKKQWKIGNRADEDGAIAALVEALGIGFPTACLLYQRGYRTPSEAASFLRLEGELLHDPFLMADMAAACTRVTAAIDRKEKIAVYGDYDVDGVTAVSLLCLYLRSRGADVSYYIPNRVGEGYGVNRAAVEALVKGGVTLLLTVDTGITASEEVCYAASLGCDTVITDHHECQSELPAAVAVVNPRRPDCSYPFKELAGVGVAFKLVTALEYTKRKNALQSTEGFLSELCEQYIDLVALGTVADVMPLRDENRLIVSMGLKAIEASPRPGLRALSEASESGKGGKKKAITTSFLGFTLAPRINAAGRLRSASLAAELFLTESKEEAAAIAAELCEINRLRQEEENRILSEIRARIDADPALGEAPVIVLEDDGWNHGVIGIVSSRITERYGKPSILISFEGEDGKGSGRSVKGLNLVEALGACADLLVKYGGHELAAGLTVRRADLPAFRERLCAYAAERLAEKETVTTLEIDCELYPAELTLKQAEELSLLEPCGISNPVPLFCLRDALVREALPMGQNRHTKLLLEAGGRRFTAVFFGNSPEELGYVSGDRCDIAFQLSVNEYQGVRTEQLLLRDIRPSEAAEGELTEQARRYDEIRSGRLAPPPSLIPLREDFVRVYLHLKRTLPPDGGTVGLSSLLRALSDTPTASGPIGYVKLRLVLDILAESGVLKARLTEGGTVGKERYEITVPHLETKVDLERSWLYKQLKNSAKTTVPES